jgi:peroxiredoxin
MKSTNVLIILLIIFSSQSCQQKTIEKLQSGTYRVSLAIKDYEVLPFNFEVINAHKIKIHNGEEVIFVDDISYKNDSVYINMPVFTSYLVAKVDDGLLNGFFVKKELNRYVPFASIRSETRFDVAKAPKTNITGNWMTTFSPNSDKDRYIAKGIFKQNGQHVSGTFRTTTGDYRYLNGVMNGNTLKLSTFDGAHAFLFKATVTDSTMTGSFYSGNHWKEPFVAYRDELFNLPDANTLTMIKKDAEKFTFSFPDASGKMISLTDERFKDKVVIVQLFGTWCPNCLDESVYYSDFYKKNKSKGVEIVALAFEYVKTKEKAFQHINKFKKDIGIDYPVLLAQIGSTNKAKAQEKLPMLEHVLSYPTTVFIDTKGHVRKIHTGFNGPATGQKYLDYKADFEKFIAMLLGEK